MGGLALSIAVRILGARHYRASWYGACTWRLFLFFFLNKFLGFIITTRLSEFNFFFSPSIYIPVSFFHFFTFYLLCIIHIYNSFISDPDHFIITCFILEIYFIYLLYLLYFIIFFIYLFIFLFLLFFNFFILLTPFIVYLIYLVIQYYFLIYFHYF